MPADITHLLAEVERIDLPDDCPAQPCPAGSECGDAECLQHLSAALREAEAVREIACDIAYRSARRHTRFPCPAMADRDDWAQVCPRYASHWKPDNDCPLGCYERWRDRFTEENRDEWIDLMTARDAEEDAGLVDCWKWWPQFRATLEGANHAE